MTSYDNYWRATTLYKDEASRYRIEDRQIDYAAIKNWYQSYTKYSNFYHYDKPSRTYYLPISLHKRNHWLWTDIDMVWDFKLYDYQWDAVKFVSNVFDSWKKSAMVVSWTWTGKTYTMLWITYQFKRKTLIVVPTKLIAKWVNETFKVFCDSKVVVSWDIKKKNFIFPDVMITTASSFNNMYDTTNWMYQVLILDEIQYMPEKRVWQINMWKWQFVCWLTATPERKAFWIDWYKIMFWNIYDTEKQSLPVKVLTYDYQYNYSISEFMKAQEWLPPDSPEVYRRLYWQNIDRVEHLEIIISELKNKWFNKFVIFTDRIDNVELIVSNIKILPTVKLTWKTDKEEFRWIIKSMQEYIIVAIDKCAWVWFDLPELECWILFMSTSWNNTLDQSAGRMRRKYWDKEYAFYVDFIDTIQISSWKKKKLWRYERNRIYKNKKRSVESFENFIWLSF